MNPACLIPEIAATYRKHGWTLRRILLSENARQAAENVLPKHGADVIVETAEINALWFSRCSGANGEAWELRRVNDAPFALFENFPLGESEEVREAKRREIERRMQEKSKK